MQSDTQNQSVDVLLPVYNGAATIEESVASLLDQTHRNLRILVIDDGSTDATPTFSRGWPPTTAASFRSASRMAASSKR